MVRRSPLNVKTAPAGAFSPSPLKVSTFQVPSRLSRSRFTGSPGAAGAPTRPATTRTQTAVNRMGNTLLLDACGPGQRPAKAQLKRRSGVGPAPRRTVFPFFSPDALPVAG